MHYPFVAEPKKTKKAYAVRLREEEVARQQAALVERGQEGLHEAPVKGLVHGDSVPAKGPQRGGWRYSYLHCWYEYLANCVTVSAFPQSLYPL